MRDFKDESFIQQFLSPKVIRDFHLFALVDDDQNSHIEITAIHDDAGYRQVRAALAEQYNLSFREPDIQVWEARLRGDRSLILRHQRHNRRNLDAASAQEVLRHLHALWGFPVRLETCDGDHKVSEFNWPVVEDPVCP